MEAEIESNFRGFDPQIRSIDKQHPSLPLTHCSGDHLERQQNRNADHPPTVGRTHTLPVVDYQPVRPVAWCRSDPKAEIRGRTQNNSSYDGSGGRKLDLSNQSC